MKNCFIIPAYEPTRTLVELLNELLAKTDYPVFVVDDGSQDQSIFHNPVFTNKRIILLKHAINLGKGAALKTAFNHILVHHPHIEGCVTLDADGQHSIGDAITVSAAMQKDNVLILGVRNFSFQDKRIPLKSWVGNLLTRYIWRFVTGKKITDTQTGLRGIPVPLMKECLHIAANRYEFEMEMLLKAQEIGVRVHEMPIETIYINNNRGSHFSPFFDSLKIYFVIFRFSLSSLLSYIVDCFFFFLFIFGLSFSVGISFFGARLIALFFNYNVNKKAVFGLKTSHKNVFFKYLIVFIVNMYIGFIFLRYTQSYGYNVFYSKFAVEGILFFFNFFLQREWVFKREALDYE